DLLAVGTQTDIVRGTDVFGKKTERTVIPAEERIQPCEIAVELHAVCVAKERPASGGPIADALVSIGIVDRHAFLSGRSGNSEGQSGQRIPLLCKRFQGYTSSIIEIAAGKVRVVRLV